MATVRLLQERSLREQSVLAEHVPRALNNRAVIEQAKGMLAGNSSLDVCVGFTLMKPYIRAFCLVWRALRETSPHVGDPAGKHSGIERLPCRRAAGQFAVQCRCERGERSIVGR